MKMKKVIAILAAMVCGVTLITGCGSSSSGETETSSDVDGTTDDSTVQEEIGEKTLVYLSPSMDILYWQWVEDGVKQAAEEAGYKVVTYDSGNSATEQATNAQTAITNGAAGVILSPVSSTSCPTVLDACEEAGIPCTIAAIGTEEGVDNYTCFASADDETSGYDAGMYLIEKAEELGSKKIGVIALPMDRTNAQKKMAGLEKAVEETGAEIAQTIQCEDLTVSEAVSLINDLLTANPDITGIYCMYEQAGTGAVTALETAGLEGEIAIVSSDGSPESIALVREGKIAGIVVQEAVGQGLVATEELCKALNGEEIAEKIVETPEPLVTTENIDDPEIQEILELVYPASAGSY
ncbi:MAG: substrate-binding domain-containing protein [Lachnospiraceae bacterium]